MALDMDQLRKMFYEECRENLEVLETILLGLDPDDVEQETINTIFRAAHSIKGGAATFNLFDISEFTHSVEAYLDEVRNHNMELSAHSVDVLLKSGDCITEMLEGHENGEPVESELKQSVTKSLGHLLNGEDKHKSPSTVFEPAASSVTANEFEPTIEPSLANDTQGSSSECLLANWQIEFAPHRDLFFSGNDPLRIIAEIKELDPKASIVCNGAKLPDLAELEAELCYLSWRMEVSSEIDKDALVEVFEWVEDQCELSISKPQSTDPEKAVPQPNSVEPNITNEPTQLVDSNTNEAELNKGQVNTTAESGNKQNKKTPAKNAKAESAVSSIRVDIDKVDSLINLVGELVITQSMLTEIGNDFTEDKLEKLKTGLDQLLQNSKDLQENVLNIRMLPMSFAFSRFPRLVRDLTGRLGKQVDLQIKGESTELDKTVLERIVDPLVHLVRNGVDHGIEMPDVRSAHGKPDMGVIELNAFHQGGSIIIEVKDDGGGIDCDRLWQKAVDKGVLPSDSKREEMSDQQVVNLIFAPGFSMADEVSDISGRGVGMDVVKRNIEELGGNIEVESKLGLGSAFTISLPLTLAILDGQLVKVAGQVYIIPLLTIVESIQIEADCVKHASGGVELYRLRDENIPLLRLHEEFEMGESGDLEGHIMCLVEGAGSRVGLLIDDLLDQQQVVIKSLESNYCKVPGISGATILGDGSVSLILDIQGLITSFLRRHVDSKGGLAA
ncbi:chemotaxis protein CheA [Vibrio tapetis subsp. quintayensis]|uniref:chemotaxis protein CheA n=1 Tax=Vibrio tapetis TaxID=52443 RepID=UPI0025B59832|nr:chemotaxis protein CheA [Vibrio tapetis]MDN3682023.1 chemotaxis protein CheA [Vibrio tapetis subsp. quintayensis]